MGKLAKLVTEYVLIKGMITEKERQEYEYGFLIAIEKGISLVISFSLAIIFDTIIEAFIFFIIFIPIRKYAGGLHLKKYINCLILSCLTFSVVMVMSRIMQINRVFAILGVCLLEILIILIYPVENTNRLIDEQESKFFKGRLILHLLINIIILGLCVIFNKDQYIVVIAVTLFIIVCTMFIGKRNYHKNVSVQE